MADPRNKEESENQMAWPDLAEQAALAWGFQLGNPQPPTMA